VNGGPVNGGPVSESLVDLIVDDPGWTETLPGLAALADTAARLALEAADLDPKHWSLCILACGDARIADLNREFRGKPVPTNVLSWPAFDLAPKNPGERPAPPPQAKSGPPPLKDHVIHLILHGCLHLLGFDHETDEDAETMEGVETRALARINVADPYLRSDAGQQPPD
jgi:probable rRNA maturation factor